MTKKNTTSVKKEVENLEGSEISDKDFLCNDAFENEINKKNNTKERNTKS